MRTRTTAQLRSAWSGLILATLVVSCLGHCREMPAADPAFTGLRLKELAPIDGSADFLIGAAINGGALNTAAEENFQRDFELIVPANEFKQTAIHPEPGVWRWKKADALIEYAEQHHYQMRLHAPLSPQCSAWAEEDHRTSDELLQNLEEYMTEICRRYNGKPHVKWMDIVNESVTDKGEWFGPKPGTGSWQNPWTQIGFDESHPLHPPLYIQRAFEVANQHAPNIKLLLNQHAGMEQPMWEKVKATVLYLREKGLRIDGVGWQGHVEAGWEKDPANLKHLDELISWAHKNKLEFHVTENTVWMGGRYEADEQTQAATYAAILRTLLAHRKTGVVVWNAWQLRDVDIQRAELKGTMYDDEGRPKAAYYAVQKELETLSQQR